MVKCKSCGSPVMIGDKCEYCGKVAKKWYYDKDGNLKNPVKESDINFPGNNWNYMYTVKKGDSLWSISSEFYGVGMYWKRIAEANNLSCCPHCIYPGQNLIIPK